MKKPMVSVVFPVRNEEKSLGQAIKDVSASLESSGYSFEVVVSDSSTDKSPQIAKNHKAKLISHGLEGYGNAYLNAFGHVRGKYVFMADPDGSYDLGKAHVFIRELERGYDFVIGNRFTDGMEKGSMPYIHRRIGNPMLSKLTRFLFKLDIRDVHCGMRAIRSESLEAMDLHATGMEFATEMVMKAREKNLKIKEMPIAYRKRKGDSKLNTFSDGWRHLRFLLLFSPDYLFLYPGLLLTVSGIVATAAFYYGIVSLLEIKFYFHPMFASTLATVVGYQLLMFSLFSRTYASTHLGREDVVTKKLAAMIGLEKAAVMGFTACVVGFFVLGTILYRWLRSGFGELDEVSNSIIGLTLISVGVQTVSSAFMLSILSIGRR